MGHRDQVDRLVPPHVGTLLRVDPAQPQREEFVRLRANPECAGVDQEPDDDDRGQNHGEGRKTHEVGAIEPRALDLGYEQPAFTLVRAAHRVEGEAREYELGEREPGRQYREFVDGQERRGAEGRPQHEQHGGEQRAPGERRRKGEQREGGQGQQDRQIGDQNAKPGERAHSARGEALVEHRDERIECKDEQEQVRESAQGLASRLTA